jgi:hypothetical protein
MFGKGRQQRDSILQLIEQISCLAGVGNGDVSPYSSVGAVCVWVVCDVSGSGSKLKSKGCLLMCGCLLFVLCPIWCLFRCFPLWQGLAEVLVPKYL